MKVIAIALVVLIFNIALSGVAHTGLFETAGVHYESDILNTYNNSLPSNVSTIEETEQYGASMNIVGVIFDTLTWNWVYQFIPAELHEGFVWLVTGLNIISLFLIGVGFIELFTKRGII